MFANICSLSRFSFVAAAIALSACDLNDPTAPEQPQPPIVTNSSILTSATIHELNLAGMANDDGVEFTAVIGPDGAKLRLRVVDGELVAYNPGGPVAHGAEMVGWTLLIEKDGKADEIMILGHEAGPVSKYAFAMRNEEGEVVNLCPAFAGSPEQPTATLIANERYDLETKEVIAEQESWVTFACQGEALFKMKSMGYVPDETKAIHRQATLKMITADYCGTGHSFTDDGTPLIWKNYGGSIGGEAGEAQIEALWNEYGAMCLTAPRLASLAEVAEHCTLPVCDEEIIAKAEIVGYEWTTWTP